MNDLLTKYNYSPSGKCNCDGFSTDKYKNGDYQLRVRTRHQTFRVKEGGRSLTGWVPIAQMENVLKNIHNVHPVTAV
jgi:hypothetical protein